MYSAYDFTTILYACWIIVKLNSRIVYYKLSSTTTCYGTLEWLWSMYINAYLYITLIYTETKEGDRSAQLRSIYDVGIGFLASDRCIYTFIYIYINPLENYSKQRYLIVWNVIFSPTSSVGSVIAFWSALLENHSRSARSEPSSGRFEGSLHTTSGRGSAIREVRKL